MKPVLALLALGLAAPAWAEPLPPQEATTWLQRQGVLALSGPPDSPPTTTLTPKGWG